MGGAERVRGFLHDPARLLHRQLAAPANSCRHRLAVHVAHDEVHQALALADAVDGNDVRVGEAGSGLRLAGEPLTDVLLEGELGREHLDGHAALKPLVARTVHHSHAPAPDLPLDGVCSAQSFAQAGCQGFIAWRGHGL